MFKACFTNHHRIAYATAMIDFVPAADALVPAVAPADLVGGTADGGATTYVPLLLTDGTLLWFVELRFRFRGFDPLGTLAQALHPVDADRVPRAVALKLRSLSRRVGRPLGTSWSDLRAAVAEAK